MRLNWADILLRKGIMAPPKAAPDSSPEQPSGHDEFIESLVAFATERG